MAYLVSRHFVTQVTGYKGKWCSACPQRNKSFCDVWGPELKLAGDDYLRCDHCLHFGGIGENGQVVEATNTEVSWDGTHMRTRLRLGVDDAMMDIQKEALKAGAQTPVTIVGGRVTDEKVSADNEECFDVGKESDNPPGIVD